MQRGDSTLHCLRCGASQGCVACAPTALTSRQAMSEILSVIARVRRPTNNNATDAVLMETERMCRALLGTRG